MSQIEHHVTGQQYWRSLEQLAEAPEVVAQLGKEFPGYTPEHMTGTSRGSFMKLMAASMALAGVTLSGCRRWPEEKLVPQTSNTEGRIPGISQLYATTMELGGVGVGLLAVSYDGRPIKVEGNPTRREGGTAMAAGVVTFPDGKVVCLGGCPGGPPVQ